VLEDQTDFPWDDDQRTTISGPLVAHFGDLTERAVRFIEDSPAIVGCVAWLTEPRLLGALAGRDTSIVVQKEDFLRPDARATEGWAARLRASYGLLHNSFARFQFPAPLGFSSYATDPTLEPVRCVGNHNSNRSPAMPRMHHKFLVRLEYDEDADSAADHVRPVAVWTGSFNFSKNAGYSFENAVEIHDAVIARSYFEEFSRVMSLSEPLEWESNWVYPEWRIGT